MGEYTILVKELWAFYSTLREVSSFPLGEFVSVNREKSNSIYWLATNTDDITTQSHSLFACSREKKSPSGKRALQGGIINNDAPGY